MTFSKRLKKSRENKHMTLAELGEKIGRSEATVQRYESGNIKNLKNDTIQQIADALDVSPAYLMGWEEEQETIAAHFDKDSLTDEEMEEVRQFIDFVKNRRK